MKRIFYLITAASVSLTFAACRTSPPPFPKFEGRAPRTIAVLPVDGSLPARERGILRKLVGGFLAEKQFTKLDDAFVDRELALEGLRPWAAGWIPDDAALARFGKKIGAEAFCTLSGFEDERVSAAVFYKRGLSGTVKWFDVASGKSIWTAPVSASRTGGLLLESGQIIKAVSNTIESAGEEQFVTLAATIALELADAFPVGPAAVDAPAKSPVVSVRIESPGDLRPGDPLTIRASGAPRCRAYARIGDSNLQYPLHEETPGFYAATIRIESGAGEIDGPVSVILYDELGGASAPAASNSNVAIRARRLEPPASVRVEPVAGSNRKFKIQWSAVAGAESYEVIRLGAGPPFAIDARGATSLEDEIPAGTSGAVWAVSAVPASGAPGPPSAPASVAIK
ncbi:MAG: hypothetical protein HY286_02695 [Planctomycetes bacterium]|nr:hypothetical protein [Planctomycetota bacterium]